MQGREGDCDSISETLHELIVMINRTNDVLDEEDSYGSSKCSISDTIRPVGKIPWRATANIIVHSSKGM